MKHLHAIVLLTTLASVAATSEPLNCNTLPGFCGDGRHCEMVDGRPTCVQSTPAVMLNNAVQLKTNGIECATNEEFFECGTACEPSCADEEHQPKMCTMQCIVNVCQCSSGFMRNFDGNCVEPEKCDNNTAPTSCDSMFCPMGTKCTQADIECAENATCPQPPPVCIAEATPEDPCAALECGEGFMCKVDKVMCFVPPCHDIASCVPEFSSSTVCATNEEFRECGTACEPSCADDESKPKMCTMQCIPNVCQCKSGFARNFNGECVERMDCDNSTGTTCDTMFCPVGTKCTQASIKCATNMTCPQPPSVCIAEETANDPCAALDCQEGFVCEKEKVMCFVAPCDEIASCVPEATDSTDCAANEEFRECGTACEPSCADDVNEPKMCTDQCILNVCQCRTGFVRNLNGTCVEREMCDMTSNSTICAANEEFRECGTACEPSCADDENKSKMCTMQCILNVCQCKSGFVRNLNGDCVERKMCDMTTNSTECATNEEFRECGTACEPSCADDDSKPKMCTMQCIMNVCQCKSGFARNFNGDCVERMNCDDSTGNGTSCETMSCPVGTKCEQVMSKCAPGIECTTPTPMCIPQASNTTKCGMNERFLECGSACEPSCLEPSPEMCTEQCLMNVCQCESGFVRDSSKGKCVELEQCMEQSLSCDQRKCPKGTTCEQALNAADPGHSMPSSCRPDRSLCNTVRCGNGTFCDVIELNCTTPPCEYMAQCVEEPEQNITTSCANVRLSCNMGEECGMVDGTPSCVKSNHTGSINSLPGMSCSCAAVTCMVGSQCVESRANGSCSAQCVPIKQDNLISNSTVTCANVRMTCMDGEECGMVNGTPQCVKINGSAGASQCGVNEEFSECVKCEGDCGEQIACPRWCNSGCHCKLGFVRSFATGGCVLEEECKPQTTAIPSLTTTTRKTTTGNIPDCDKKEVWNACGGCEPTCNNTEPICNRMCSPGKCVCGPGLVRFEGSCVPFHKCPKEDNTNSTCGPNEIETDCLPKCENTCRGIDECNVDISADACVSGCVCRANYKRNKFGRCTHRSQCYKKVNCHKHESWNKCMPCEAKCSRLDQENCAQSCFSGCACDEGYARNDDDQCVPIKKCDV